jgi:hypothetical protein
MVSCPLHKFKHIFGNPNSGVHSYRLLDVAAVDYVLTIILAIVTAYYSKIPLVLSTIGWFIIGMIFHALFGVNTSALKYLRT